MPRQVVILHGWSDESESFKPLARFLKRNGFDTHPIHLGDYVSMQDDVRIDDVVKRMEAVIREAQARTGPRKLAPRFDLIVHSTGGLVARHWISTYYQDRPCPVQNFVMLAPANFGSALAHLGRSMLGRITKGWSTGFETGEEVLYALELGSPYQWALAQNDLFVPDGAAPRSVTTLYGADKTRPFVLTGTFPYQELAARITNENGSDGTVRVAATNMNCQGMTVDFTGGPARLQNPEVRRWRRRGGDNVRFPMAVLPDRNHGDIILPNERGASRVRTQQQLLGNLILQALRSTSANYRQIADEWREISSQTRALAGKERERRQLFGEKVSPDYFHEYFQLVVRAEDEFGKPIPDYFLRFVKKQSRNLFAVLSPFGDDSAYFHDEVLESAHTHRRANEYRNFYMDRYDLMGAGGWYSKLDRASERKLSFTVTAVDPGDNIAYFERTPEARGVVLLHQQGDGERWLKRNSTHFIRLIIPRAGKPDIFQLSSG